jgi:hypothetical protein
MRGRSRCVRPSETGRPCRGGGAVVGPWGRAMSHNPGRVDPTRSPVVVLISIRPEVFDELAPLP